MSLYICLDELLADPVWKFTYNLSDKHGEGYADGLDAVQTVLEGMGVICLTKCKDCIWYEPRRADEGEPTPTRGFCREPKSRKGMAGAIVDESHFCSLAKRKDENQ